MYISLRHVQAVYLGYIRYVHTVSTSWVRSRLLLTCSNGESTELFQECMSWSQLVQKIVSQQPEALRFCVNARRHFRRETGGNLRPKDMCVLVMN